jgi:hypothetical protein
MREIVEYRTLVEGWKVDIDEVVNTMLRNGWELFGQPSFAVTDGDKIRWSKGNSNYPSRFCFVQVMVRYKKEESV